MNLWERFVCSCKNILQTAWIVIIPLILDLGALFSYMFIFKENYSGVNKFFLLKFGTIQAPPSIDYLLENYPSIIFHYNTAYGPTGLISSITFFNILLLLSFILVYSFLKSGYMGCIERAGREKTGLLDFILLGNKYWFQYFILELVLSGFSLLLMIGFSYSIITVPLSIVLYFVQYSIVVDKGSIFDKLKIGISTLFGNLGTTIKMALYYGALMSTASPVVLWLSHYGTIVLIFAIFIVDYPGIAINKSVLEVYRELRCRNPHNPPEQNENPAGSSIL